VEIRAAADFPEVEVGGALAEADRGVVEEAREAAQDEGGAWSGTERRAVGTEQRHP